MSGPALQVGDWVRVELDGARGVEGELTCVMNQHGHGVIQVEAALGDDVQCYVGKPFTFTPGPHVRLYDRTFRWR